MMLRTGSFAYSVVVHSSFLTCFNRKTDFSPNQLNVISLKLRYDFVSALENATRIIYLIGSSSLNVLCLSLRNFISYWHGRALCSQHFTFFDAPHIARP
jgi:hypothetical protein